MSRPKKSPAKRLSYQVGVRLTPDVHRKLTFLSQRAGVSLVEYIRGVLSDHTSSTDDLISPQISIMQGG